MEFTLISIAAPAIETEEMKAVRAVLESGILAQGPKVAELESAFAGFCGTKYAAAVNSGTAALHAALFAAGVGPDDEVITTPFSFIATINPILFMGAKPILVDIDPLSFNIDVSKVAAAITPRTKAIMPVHLYGQPADWDELERLARKHHLAIIEDACQSIGAAYKSKKTGSLGDMGCFSFYATKNIMCGEGGMVTTNKEEYAQAIRRFRQHGMGGPYEYMHEGYNYRMTDVLAAIAVEQLKKAEQFTRARQKNAKALDAGLADVTGLILPHTKPSRTHVYHQYTLRVTPQFRISRQELVNELRERGIITGVYYPKPLHALPRIAAYGYKMGDFPQAEKAAEEVIALPVHPRVSDEDTQTIIQALKEIANA